MNAPAQGAILFGGEMGKAKTVWQISGFVYAILLLIFAAFFASAQIFTLSSATESSSQVNVNISNPSDSTISALGYFIRLVSENNVDIELNPSRDGTIAYGLDNVYAWTNSPSGYKLYISTNSTNASSQKLYKDRDTSSYAFNPTANTNGDGTLDNNSWGYSLDNLAFTAVPTRGSETLIRTTNEPNQYADLDDPLTKTPVYYGAKANLEIPSGDYYGTVLYSAMAEASETAAGEAIISPASTTDLAGGTTVTITTSLYTNIEDLGEVSVYIGENGNASDVCANPSTSTEGGVLEVTCRVPVHGAGEFDVFVNVPKFGKTYTIPNGFEYIAQFFTISTMQEMTSAICASATTPSVSATQADTTGAHAGDTSYVPQRSLRDIRDGNSYVIRKLADGECWMVENLRAINVKLMAADSDNLSTDFMVPASNGSWSTDGNTVSRAYIDPIGGTAGVLYSWYAATAGTNRALTGAGTVSGSICPRAWELPRGSGNKSWPKMVGTIYNGSASAGVMRNWPISVPATGMMIPTYTTTGGWGNNYSIHFSAESPSTTANYVSIGSSGRVELHYNHPTAYVGFSVRCVAR